MAKIVLGAVLESVRGKLGGTAIRKTRAGHILTHTVHPAQRKTAAEARIRGNINRIAGDWAGLTDLQRDAWNRYASMSEGPLTGANVHLRHNTRLLNADHLTLVQIDWPPKTPSTPDHVQGLAATLSAGIYTIVWTAPSSESQWVQVQYSPQVGFSMTGKHRWVLLPATRSDVGQRTHAITLPDAYSMYYRARSIDIQGRVSPWTTPHLSTAAAPSWLTGYDYRKKISLSAGSAGSGSNYQVVLMVGETAGASGEDFDLEGHAENFGTDIRFTTDDMVTELDFWRKEITGSPPDELAEIWVEVSADLDSPQDIYCYYGKAGDADASSGPDTFALFDDFSTTPNGDPPIGWTIASGTWQVTNGILYGPSTSSVIHKVYCDASHGLTSYDFYASFAVPGSSPGEANIFYKEANVNNTYRLKSYGSDQILVTESGSHTETQARSPTGWWYNIEFCVLASGNIKTYYTSPDHGLPRTKVHDVNDTFTADEGRIGLGDYATNLMFDNVRVRKFTATEPAYSSAGSEETP